MYANSNDSLIKNFTEKGAFHVDPNRLKLFTCYLPIWYTISTLYEFTSASDVTLYLKKKYFVLSDFNIDVKIKGRPSPIVKNVIESTLVEECIENIYENKTLNIIPLNAILLNVYKKVCSSCMVYIVLFVVFLITSICTCCVFAYFNWYQRNIK